nr:hypothetical protein [Tanacetum cinerariifolium]
MADVNLNAPTIAPPTRTDDQILSHSRWVPIRKSNCYLDVEKSQSNLIYKIDVDILKHTNYFRAFTASLTILSIYIQQFWDTIQYDIDTGKKKANPIVIPSIRFIKLTIHPYKASTNSTRSQILWEPNEKSWMSPLHLPYEEYILGYLKFSAKGTKREVFGMPISNELITADIQGSDLDSPAPKPAKATKKSKPSARKSYLRPPIIKPSSSQQPKPKLAPAKSQEKKRKLVIETSDKPSPAKRSKPGLVTKRRKPTSSLRSVDEFVDEENQTLGNFNRSRGSRKGKRESLADSDSKSDEEVPPMVEVGGQDKGQAGPNPGVLIEGQARSDLGDDVEPQPQSSPVVHARLNLKHMDLEATDVSAQLHPEQMDEGFTATTYLNVQENLKLTVEEHVILKEPTSFTGTLSSLQHLAKDFSFGDLFFNDKPSEAENEKITVSKAVDEIVTDAVDWAIQAPLQNRFRDLPGADIKEILHQRMPCVSLIPEDLHMDDDMAPDEHVYSSDDEDIRNAYIPKASALASTYKPPPENSLLTQTGDMAMFMDWFCKRQRITKLKPQDLEGPAFELVKVFHLNDLEYLRYGSKGGRPTLSISKIKAAYYPDVGLEQMVLDQMWIEEECKYDIAAMYGISHWWFQRQRFYIDRHTSKGDRRAVSTHIRILNVVRIEVFSMYGYDYMKKIVLRGADLNEHIITKRDFKYLYPNDFKDMDKYRVQKIMRFNEIHKFSDGTLHQIDEALDYRVKEFMVNRMNPGPYYISERKNYGTQQDMRVFNGFFWDMETTQLAKIVSHDKANNYVFVKVVKSSKFREDKAYGEGDFSHNTYCHERRTGLAQTSSSARQKKDHVENRMIADSSTR